MNSDELNDEMTVESLRPKSLVQFFRDSPAEKSIYKQ